MAHGGKKNPTAEPKSFARHRGAVVFTAHECAHPVSRSLHRVSLTVTPKPVHPYRAERVAPSRTAKTKQKKRSTQNAAQQASPTGPRAITRRARRTGYNLMIESIGHCCYRLQGNKAEQQHTRSKVPQTTDVSFHQNNRRWPAYVAQIRPPATEIWTRRIDVRSSAINFALRQSFLGKWGFPVADLERVYSAKEYSTNYIFYFVHHVRHVCW